MSKFKSISENIVRNLKHKRGTKWNSSCSTTILASTCPNTELQCKFPLWQSDSQGSTSLVEALKFRQRLTNWSCGLVHREMPQNLNLYFHDLQTAENDTGCPYAKDWLQYQTTVVHCSLNSLGNNLSVIISFNIYIYIINFNETLDTKCFLPQVAVLRSWRVVGAPPRRSAPPASGRRRPGGSAARAAPPWRRAAAPRRLRDVFWNFRGNIDLFQTVPNCQTNFSEWLLILQNVCRLANFSLLTANALPHQDTKLSRYCGSTTTKGGSGTVGSWRFAWKVAMSLQCPCPTTKSCRNLA